MTAHERKLPSREDPQWEEWIRVERLSYREIAARVGGVSHQAVAKACPLPPAHAPTQVQNFRDYIPWSYDWADRTHELLEMLRQLARLDRGATVRTPVKLAAFQAFLKDARFDDGTPIGRGVVVYDRSAPAGARFFVEPWRKGDGAYSRP